MTAAANPLVVGRVNMSTPLAGTFLLEDCESIASGIRNGNWVEGGMGAFAAVADGMAAVVDPLGSAIGAGVGWLLEHMEPLKGWFNDLTGDAGEVMGFAGTWANIAASMQAASDELTRILGDLDSQRGLMIDTYRRFQGECAAHAAAAGRLSSAIGTGMQIASTIVQAVHDITRDALSQLIGTAISAVATAALTLGFGTPWAVSQVATRAASLASKVGKFITKLVNAIKKLMPLLDDAAKLFRSLQGALDKALSGAADAVRSLGRTADDVPAGLPHPSPAVRPPHAPALPHDEAVQNLVDLNRYHDPGMPPRYGDDVDSVFTFFDTDIKDLYANGLAPTLGRDGNPVFVMPRDDANLISSIEDAAVATGGAPRVMAAWRNGEDVFGIEIPVDGLNLRVPTAADAGGYEHFLEGGYTALNQDGLFTVNRIRELVVDGGSPVPRGTVLFQLLPDGSRIPIGMF